MVPQMVYFCEAGLKSNQKCLILHMTFMTISLLGMSCQTGCYFRRHSSQMENIRDHFPSMEKPELWKLQRDEASSSIPVWFLNALWFTYAMSSAIRVLALSSEGSQEKWHYPTMFVEGAMEPPLINSSRRGNTFLALDLGFHSPWCLAGASPWPQL